MAASDRNWIDGSRLVDWLQERGAQLTRPALGGHERAIRHWREGKACSVYQADRVLTRLGFHLHELPDDFWLDGPPHLESYSAQVKRQAVLRVTVGSEAVKQVARSLGCDPKTVRNWIEAGV
jgi:hypothetical protein